MLGGSGLALFSWLSFSPGGRWRRPRVASAESPKSVSCAASGYRQFDFLAGDWDVFDVGSPIEVAHARIDRILDGCALLEDFQGIDGHKGRSFTIYDATRNVWHQSWVTNRGQLLTIEGKIEAGEMVLSGEGHAAGAVVRGAWKPVERIVRLRQPRPMGARRGNHGLISSSVLR